MKIHVEYYVGGIFEVKTTDPLPKSFAYDQVESFDWRNRHGANSPGSLYWDGDIDSSGWMTPPRCQNGCLVLQDTSFYCDVEYSFCSDSLGGIWKNSMLCGYFAAIAQVEAITNLYFNQHIDPDLSEQDAASCLRGDSLFENLRDSGVVNEECFKFMGDFHEPCSTKCISPQEKIRITDKIIIQRTESEVKKALINYGPLTVADLLFANDTIHHSILLAGYDIIDEGDSLWGIEDTCIFYGSQYIGRPYWILKDSYGNSDSHHGYKYIFF